MMMRERAPGSQDLLTGCLFNVAIHLGRVRHPFEVVSIVEIDTDTSVVDLGNPARNEGFPRQLPLCMFTIDAGLYVLTQRQSITPGDRSFERLGENIVFHYEITNIGYA